MSDLAAFKHEILDLATYFVGLYEVESNARFNDEERGKILIKYMEKSGWSTGQPYCAAFCGAVVWLAAERTLAAPRLDRFKKIWTAHCMTNVNTLRRLEALSQEPSDCSLMLMRHGRTSNGHAAILLRVDGKFPYRTLATAEGNTMPDIGGDQRQGDGCYLRIRNVRKNGLLNTQGFLSAETLYNILTRQAR